MALVKGQVVRSKAGRDKEKFLVVMGFSEKGVLLCDGKERPLERPKLKNEKHLSPTAMVLADQQLLTNRSIIHGLRDYSRTVKGDE